MSNMSIVRGATLGFALLIAAACANAQDWPGWRGPNGDNKVVGFTAPKTWPKELTKKWRIEVGIGESSPVLVGDKLYVFTRVKGDEVTICLDAVTGKQIWIDKYATPTVGGASTMGGHIGTRSTPAVGANKICTLGANGVVSCLDASTGKVVWRKETGSKPQFYTSTSPIIADGKCIVFVNALTAYDLDSGDTKWTFAGGGAPYGSPVLMSAGGVRQVVTPTGGNNLVGVNLADGKSLWQTKLGGFGYQSNYSTPLVDGQNVFYSVSGKGAGGNMIALKIEKKGEAFDATEVWKKPVAAAGYHTPVFKDGLIFGVSASKNLYCLDAKTGNQLWADSKQRGECGSILNTGDVLISLSSDKELVAFKASNKSFEQVAKYTVAADQTWCVPIVAGNRIYVKDKGGALTLWTLE